jgi:hypothetical protein
LGEKWVKLTNALTNALTMMMDAQSSLGTVLLLNVHVYYEITQFGIYNVPVSE